MNFQFLLDTCTKAPSKNCWVPTVQTKSAIQCKLVEGAVFKDLCTLPTYSLPVFRMKYFFFNVNGRRVFRVREYKLMQIFPSSNVSIKSWRKFLSVQDLGISREHLAQTWNSYLWLISVIVCADDKLASFVLCEFINSRSHTQGYYQTHT